MYRKFYGLRDKPFEITPNPRFLYLNETHREALAHLIYAVREKKSFTVITGEVGTGKTTLIRSLLSTLDGKARTAYLFNPKMGVTDFLNYICEDLGLKLPKSSKGQCLAQLHDFLLACYSRKESVILIIDEAQALDPRILEEVRMLTNLETPTGKLLQVILLGQPELDKVLDRHEFRQLKQRVSLRCHIEPL
ncbi:MAG: AAA family ATPase, partial [Deltaproteobacteria bacterium]|nr:AAA family ATPase [Deltaproteobacteria bacterium]